MKRYDIDVCEGAVLPRTMSTEEVDGEWVKYSDVEALIKENERLREALERIGNVLSTVKVVELPTEDETDLADSQMALFDISLICAHFKSALERKPA